MKNILKNVKTLLLDETFMKEVKSKHSQPTSLEEYKSNRESKIKMILKKAGLKEDNFNFYIDSFKTKFVIHLKY